VLCEVNPSVFCKPYAFCLQFFPLFVRSAERVAGRERAIGEHDAVTGRLTIPVRVECLADAARVTGSNHPRDLSIRRDLPLWDRIARE